MAFVLPQARRLLTAEEVVRESRRAMTRLAWDFPFFALMGRQICFRADTSTPTAAIDVAGYCYISPLFMSRVMTHSPALWEFIVAHELMHLALVHLGRQGGRTMRRWNRACDRWINQLLTQAGIGGANAVYFLDGLLPDSSVASLLSVEDLYETEPHQHDDVTSEAALPPGRGCGIHARAPLRGEGETFPDASEVNSARMWHQILRFGIRCAAQRRGDPFAALASLQLPCVSRRALLASVAASAAMCASEPTRRRDRSVPQDILLPAQAPRASGGRIAVLVDTSTSVSAAELQKVIVDVHAIVHMGAEVFLVVHDHDVSSAAVLTRVQGTEAVRQIVNARRGGTAYGPAYAAVEARSEQYHTLIHFTDAAPGDSWPRRPANVREVVVALVRTVPLAAIPAEYRVVQTVSERTSA